MMKKNKTTSKTTIAINKESRKRLDKIKAGLEYDRVAFVDMDEVVLWLLDNIPNNLKRKYNL